jgi:chromosome segregation ATPase
MDSDLHTPWYRMLECAPLFTPFTQSIPHNMAQVLSLKELRTSSVLKAEIAKLEEDKVQLQAELERQHHLEKKLRDDLLEQKKDFEHLEKQFDHFAGIEAEFEALQQQVQMDRLEQLIDGDKKDAQIKTQLKKARDDLKAAQDELKELKQLDPLRLKRQVTDLKKKSQQQATDNQSLNNALVAARKELKEVTAEKEKLDTELEAGRNGTDFFWQSVDETWVLYESSVVLKDEKVDDEENHKRIRCMNSVTGVSVLSNGKDESDKALWLGDIAIPDEVSVEAGKRLLSIEADLDEDED